MTLDNGMDNPLPISKEGLLAAIDTAAEQAEEIHKLISADRKTDALVSAETLVQYLNILHTNIKEDSASYYPPVVRK